MVLNGQNSSWKGITSGVLLGSILGPLLFLIYINDLPDGLLSNCKLFADDTSLFSVVHDVTISSSELNSNLVKKVNGLLNGKWILILTHLSQLKK